MKLVLCPKHRQVQEMGSVLCFAMKAAYRAVDEIGREKG